MAGDHRRISLDIWDDNDWTSLTSAQQIAYLTLITSRDLSWCGVLPYLPARYALLAKDWTERKFIAAITGLEAGRFLIVDRTTAEILVRSYVRHDGLLKQPNVTKALVKAYERVHSEHLRGAIRVELARLLSETPDAKGWQGMAAASPELLDELHAMASPKGSGKGSPKGSTNPEATPFPLSPFHSSSSLRSVTREQSQQPRAAAR